KQSFAEDLLVSEGKGAIAVIAASRECAAGSNEALNREFLRRLFESGKRYRIGEALRLAKLSTYDVFNNELYNVIGDPTLRLAFPVRKASFTDLRPDTFKALSLVSANGQVGTEGNSPLPFQGKAVIKGVDSKKPVSYTTRWGTRLDYLMPGNVLFRGEAAVANGTFRISFIVPKEISYGTRTAKLSAYFWNETGDGLGAKSGIAVGGTANVLDDQGPDIQLGFSDMESFVSGGMIHPDPELLAVVKDEQTGVNLTGEIGHTLALTLDGQPAKNVTDYFQYDEGSYLQGKLHYPMIGLSEGDHEIILKAWDNANNSSVQTLSFRILRLDELRLENVLNYPNPFSSSTHFTFQLNQSAGVEIKIYTVDGRMIRKLDDVSGQPGFNMIPWDGLDEAGDSIANGVYLYRVSARIVLSDKTIEASEIGRLLIMR
ncbi:MAG TPA: C25 family cysteine peptidase, partial [bacterium]